MIQNQRNGTNSSGKRKLDPDINGMGGELAVCKYFNRWPDLSVGPHYSGYDLKVKGRKVDVKSTTYNPGYLQASKNKHVNACDIFILVYAKFPEFEIIGGATSEQLISRANLSDIGFGTNYYLEQSQLTPLELLFG